MLKNKRSKLKLQLSTSSEVLKRCVRQPLTSFITLTFCFLNLSCQTQPKISFDQLQQGHWKLKALVKDKRRGDANLVYLNVTAIKNKRIRLDVVSGLMGHLASVVIDSDQMTYILPKNKDYYSGLLSKRALARVLPLNIHPNVLYNIFFFEKVRRQDWKCSDQIKTFYCENLKEGLKITWSKNYDKVHIDHTKALVKINVSSFSSEPQFFIKDKFYISPPAWATSK